MLGDDIRREPTEEKQGNFSESEAGKITKEKILPAESVPSRLEDLSTNFIETALKNTQHEMSEASSRSLARDISQTKNEMAMISDPKGRMIAGEFGSFVRELMEIENFEFDEGDVILIGDPFKCTGLTASTNEWIVTVPAFLGNEIIGFTSMLGELFEFDGRESVSQPAPATSVFDESIRIPPLKLYSKGELNKTTLAVIMNNSRIPDTSYRKLMALVTGCEIGKKSLV